MKKTMKRWQMDKVGRENLSLVEVPFPEPGPFEVVVKVSAVSLNYRDKLIVESGMGIPIGFPFTPASDMAGTVFSVGKSVTRLKPNERVISTFVPNWIDGRPAGDARIPPYQTLGGFYPGVLSPYIAISEDWVTSAPTTLSHAEASTLPVAGLTAWFSLVELGKLRAGETVLVQGTGGVATFGIQIAKMHGAEVFVTSSADQKLSRTRKLGADHIINRISSDWVEEIYKITADRGVDHVLELVGGHNIGRSLQAVAVHGRIYFIGVLEGFEFSGPSGPLLLKSPTVHGICVGHRTALDNFVRAVDHAGLKPVIDTIYPFEQAMTALDHLDRGAFGNIVIEISDES